MRRDPRPHIFFVDNEPTVHGVVTATLEHVGAKVSCFERATDCLEQLRSKGCSLLITDIKMPGMDGIELLTEAHRLIPSLPLLAVTGYDDTRTAVRAMKAGASDFIEKPLHRQSFVSAVKSLLKPSPRGRVVAHKALTDAEMQVLRGICDGKTNKEMAQLYHRSIRTIEVHRDHIMHKLDVHNVAELVRKAIKLGLV